MQDEIVIHLARAMEVRLTEVEAARLKRTPAANPDAEDLTGVRNYRSVVEGVANG
jgi:hypothetical protein